MNTPVDSKEVVARDRGRWIATLGIALFTGPVWGILVSAATMFRTFSEIDTDGAASPDALSHGVTLALASTGIGIAAGILGVPFILAALLGWKIRERRFFWWSVILSAYWCVAIFPYGLAVGLPVLILFVTKRSEFTPPAASV